MRLQFIPKVLELGGLEKLHVHASSGYYSKNRQDQVRRKTSRVLMEKLIKENFKVRRHLRIAVKRGPIYILGSRK